MAMSHHQGNTLLLYPTSDSLRCRWPLAQLIRRMPAAAAASVRAPVFCLVGVARADRFSI